MPLKMNVRWVMSDTDTYLLTFFTTVDSVDCIAFWPLSFHVCPIFPRLLVPRLDGLFIFDDLCQTKATTFMSYRFRQLRSVDCEFGKGNAAFTKSSYNKLIFKLRCNNVLKIGRTCYVISFR